MPISEMPKAKVNPEYCNYASSRYAFGNGKGISNCFSLTKTLMPYIEREAVKAIEAMLKIGNFLFA